jgi:hypothetical protein
MADDGIGVPVAPATSQGAVDHRIIQPYWQQHTR